MAPDASSLFFRADGSVSDQFLLNLTSEGIGILVSTVLITLALRTTQLTSRWLSVRGPRRKVLEDSRADADFALACIARVATSTDRPRVRDELRQYARALVSMAKRLELTRDLFAPADVPLIVGFITDVHTANAIIETDCERDTAILPLTLKSKSFPGRRGQTIHVPAADYYTQMFYALDRLFARYNAPLVRVAERFDADFVDFLATN